MRGKSRRQATVQATLKSKTPLKRSERRRTVARPVAAEGSIKDGEVIREERVRVAVVRGEVAHRRTPRVGHGLVGGDVVRNGLSREL